MRAGERTLRSEQGAVFVQVGISIFVLMAFNVFVLDYGVMWVSRRQAQNAADAAALALCHLATAPMRDRLTAAVAKGERR